MAKELAHGLLDELQDIKSAVEQLDKKVDVLVNEPECPPTKFLFDEYRKHLLCLYPRYPVCEYLERKIYPKNESDVQLNSLDVLLKEKHVLVLGEAGYGKTYESIILLQRACTNEKTRTLIPVFISLQEYGLLYTDIIGGIKYKITPFCDGEVDKIIEQQLKEGRFLLIMDPCLAGYTLNGVELFSLRDLLHYLNQTNTVLSEHILPGPDMPIPARGSCFTWDCYSKEQKERRIALFFYYHEISYLSMVEYNFPILKKYFQRYNDAPYQVVVEVDHNEEANPHDFTSEPSIQYHYIASPTEDIHMPVIRQTREKNFFDYDQIVKDIQESYLKQGRTANHITTTRTGFTFTTTSRRTGGDDPLSDYVYSSIKESLEDVFGSMR